MSQELDEIALDHDILLCQAQGNCGNTSSHECSWDCMGGAPDPARCSRPEAWAKNVLSVGGVKHYGTEDRIEHNWCGVCPGWPGIECKSTCASTGPAADGRVKPDLIHFFDNILTTCDGDNSCYTDGPLSDPVRKPFGGTSAATPITCGMSGILFQMWHEGVFPGFGGGASVFDDRPHAATAKALLINTAYRYCFNDPMVCPDSDLTRYRQGWGMVDLENLFNIRNNLLVVDQADALENLESTTYDVCVRDGQEPLNVTLVYRDPPGATCTTQARVNDLSLKVSSQIGTVYWGNFGLMDGNGSVADNDPITEEKDAINTVENVFIEDPAPGVWHVTVSADEVVVDAVGGTPETDADYALVIAGLSQTAACCLFDATCVDTTMEVCAQQGGQYFCTNTCNTPTFSCPGIMGPEIGP